MKRLLLAATLLGATGAQAHDFAVGDLKIEHPVAYATVANAPVGGGYMEITNTGESNDRLIAVSVESTVAGRTQLHQMALEEGVMRMSEIDGGIPLPAGETVVLESGGLHVMFMQLADGLEEGESFPATLTFENSGTVEVVFNIEARPTAGGHGDHGNHGDAAATDEDAHGDHGAHGDHDN